MSGYGHRVLVLIVAALLPMAVLASVLVTDLAKRERHRLEADARAHVAALAARLDAEIESQIRSLAVLAASPLLDGGDLAGFREHASRVRERQPLWRNIFLADPDGVQIFNLRFPTAPTEPIRDDGADTLAAVLRTARPAVGGVVRAQRSGEMVIPVRVPVRDGDRTRFALTAALDPAAVAALIGEVLPKGWRGVVIDRESHIIARSSDGAASAGRLASASARDATGDHRAGEFRRGLSREGDEYAVLFLRSPLTGWTVHAGVPVDSLSVLQAGAVPFAIGGTLASLLLAGLLSWLLVRELRVRRRQEAVLAEAQHLEALGRLTGGVAHDFNNMLMVVQGAAEAIRRRRSDPDQVAAVAEAMTGAVQRGAALTRQLLSYARKQAHMPATFRLADRAVGLRLLLGQTAGPHVRTTLAIADDAWPVHADPEALEAVLVNLAANARDAMPDGGTLSVSVANVVLRKGDDEGTGLRGDFVLVAVRDTGSGIAREHLGRIFEPFFSTKPPGRGTGLGLSQVYGFARQSGGTVTVATEPGRGTTFRLYLPRSLEAPRQASVPAEPRAQPGGGRVLLVEDDADVARATEGMLRAAGYGAAAVHSADAALETLRRDGPFDLVLSDIVMGDGVSGLSLAERLRAERDAPPVVLMTGYSESLAGGADHGIPVLAKPFTAAQLVAALEAARDRRRTTAAPGR